MPRPFAARLDNFVLELLVPGPVYIPLEQLFPLHALRVFRPGWQNDLKHFCVGHADVQWLSFAGMIPAQALFARAARLDLQQAVAAQPLSLKRIVVIVLIVLIDLTTSWIHRAFHQVPWPWNFHAIHDSSRCLDWLDGSCINVVDVIVTRAPRSCRCSSSAWRQRRCTPVSCSCRSTPRSSTPPCAGSFQCCAG